MANEYMAMLKVIETAGVKVFDLSLGALAADLPAGEYPLCLVDAANAAINDALTSLPAQPVAECYEELPPPAYVKGCYDYYSAEQMRAHGDAKWRQALAEADTIHKDLLKTMAESTIADRAQLAERVAVLEAALMDCARHPRKNQRDHIVSKALAATPQPHADEAAKGVPVHQFLNETENGVKNWSDCKESELAAWAALGIEHRTLYTAPPSPAEDGGNG
jgi:hypothetical protein